MAVKHVFEIEYFFESNHLYEEMSVPEFEALIEPLVEKAAEVAESALAKTTGGKAELNGILLAGGTSQVPLVRELLEQRLECSAMIASKDLMWLIAKGAANHHRDLMTRPKESTKLRLGSDLMLETFTHGRLTETVLVPAHQVLPHAFSRTFPVNSHNSSLTVQLLTVSGTEESGLLRLARREINLAGMTLSEINVKVTVDKNKSIHLAVTDPKSGVPLENVEVQGDFLSTPEEIRAARSQYGFKDVATFAEPGNQRYAIGIDLGTTTCEAYVWDLQEKKGERGIEEPQLSQVLVRENGTVTVDNGNHNTAMEGYFSNFKVDIGADSESEKYTAHGKRWPPEILSAHLLATIWRQLQAKYGSALTEAVVTVPSDFSEDQMALVQNAARIAGIKDPILLSEPVAAYLAYADAYPMNRKAGQTFLVFDFGGGTTDVCVIETKASDQVDICATDGNNRIGGKDLTNAIAYMIIEQFTAKKGLALKKADRERLRKDIFKEADKAKVELSMALVTGGV